MSVSHPLIKDLKVHILQLVDSPKPITDENGKLLQFCESLEKIFCRGVLPLKNALGIFRSPDCWNWLDQIASEKFGASYSFISSVEEAKKCRKVNTNKGRLRFLIRASLVKRCIHVPVQIIIKEQRLRCYYKIGSILGDDILSEMFLSILKLLSRIEFKLDLNRSRFLDETWTLPNSTYLYLVPCTELGLSVIFVDGKAVIFSIAPFSVAAETDKVKVGDILDDLNEHPITDQVQGALGTIMKKSSGLPVTAHIIKAEWNNYLFPSIVPLIKRAGLDPATLTPSISSEEHQTKKQENQEVEEVCYLGAVPTGSKGDVKEISKAIEMRLSKLEDVKSELVIFDYHDLEIRVLNAQTKEVILKHSFLEISSCGATGSAPTYFAFIAGDKSYTECKDFKCHIFHCDNSNEVEHLLRNIAQGFKRTHCAV